MIDSELAAITTEIRNHRHHCFTWHGLSRLEELLEQLEQQLEPYRTHFTPAAARITAYPKGGIVATTTFPSGSTINLVGTVDNSAGVAIPNAVTWAADQGTITTDPSNPELATLVNVPDGQVNVTMTTTNGIVAQHTFTVTDVTPATADFTATAA